VENLYFIIIKKSIFILSIVIILLFIFEILDSKIRAIIQGRIGRKNKLNDFAVQPFADFIKILSKQEKIRNNQYKFIYELIPILALFFSFIPLAAVPLQNTFYNDGLIQTNQLIKNGSELLFIIFFIMLNPMWLIIAGYASSNKYSLIGSMRLGVKCISQNIILLILVLTIVVDYQTMDLSEITNIQKEQFNGLMLNYGFIRQPFTMIMFFIYILINSNIKPFDNINNLIEEKMDVLYGYNSLKNLMFYISNKLIKISLLIVFVIVFFGGYSLPFNIGSIVSGLSNIVTGLDYNININKIKTFFEIATLLGKVILLYISIIFIKYSIPRLRINSELELIWNKLIPICFLNLIITIFLVI
jgi:NADH-quinone oxidoreductase subunit H